MLVSKGKGKRPVVVNDSDESDSDMIAVKLEAVLPQYLNRPVDASLAAARVKSNIADLKQQLRVLDEALETISSVADDLAECLALGEDENDAMADDVVPPDGVSLELSF